MGKFKWVALFFVVLFFFAGGFLLMTGMEAVKEARAVTFESVDWSGLEDGRREGAYTIGPVSARVAVTLEDGRILGIEILEHQNGWGEKAEAIVADMARENRVDVEAVSGATVSSRVLQKAVEAALRP